MAGENVCVAGVDLETLETIRLSHPQPTRSGLSAIGWLRVGEVVAIDVRRTLNVHPPHLEDHDWNPRDLEKLRVMGNAEIVQLLRPSAFNSIEQAFGEASRRSKDRNSAWAPGGGERSLATLKVRYVRFDLDPGGRVRASLRDNEEMYWSHIPFQDLVVREHRLSEACCGENHLQNVDADFKSNWGILRVGLTRPFSPTEDAQDAACWLQVTNVFARDRAHF